MFGLLSAQHAVSPDVFNRAMAASVWTFGCSALIGIGVCALEGYCCPNMQAASEATNEKEPAGAPTTTADEITQDEYRSVPLEAILEEPSTDLSSDNSHSQKDSTSKVTTRGDSVCALHQKTQSRP
jgi:hypothetical protein